MKKAALYVRVSTSSRSRYGDTLAYHQTPEIQEDLLRRDAQERGWQVAQVYTEYASGSREKRPALSHMLSDARKGQFDVLMVWRFDRLSRGALHFLQVVEELRNLGIDFVSHEQAFDTTTPMGRFTLTMFAGLAELERQVIHERVSVGLEYARKHGTKSGRPIGRPKVVFHRDRVPQLRSQGLSWRKIAEELGVGITSVRRAYAARFE